MDGPRLVIDNLKLSPAYVSKIKLRENEFFECDYCGTLCEMPMSVYKSYRESEILKAKFKCERCVKILRQSKVTKEQVLHLKSKGLTNTQIAKELGVSQPTLYLQLNKLGLTEPRKKPNKDSNKDTVLIKPTVNQSLTTDVVSSPPHYTSSSIECIDAIMSAVEGLDPQEAVHVANIMKYVWRFKRKNGKQDLEKAQWYLKRLIELQEV
jgi:hypothetical protein